MINPKFEYPPAKVLYGGQVETRNNSEYQIITAG
jgi:hypothetical protein